MKNRWGDLHLHSFWFIFTEQKREKKKADTLSIVNRINKMTGDKRNFCHITYENKPEKTWQHLKRKKGNKVLHLAGFAHFSTMNINGLHCIPWCGSWWFWWMWLIVSLVLSDRKASSLFLYKRPLGYHCPSLLQKDSKSELLWIIPLRN